MRAEQTNAGHRRAIQLALFACVLAAGFVLLLSHAGRAHAVELTTPLLPGATVDVPIAVPAVATDFAAPDVAHVTSSPPPVSPRIAAIELRLMLPPAADAAVETITDVDGTNPTATSPADPAAATSAPLTTRPVIATQAGPVRVERISTDPAPPVRPFSPAPAPRPPPPAVPATSSLARADGGSTQLAATLAVAIALVILFPVGITRARRLVLPTLSFRPLTRPG